MIILKFDEDNAGGSNLEHMSTVLWFINNAQNSIENNYAVGSSRRLEMAALCKTLRKQLIAQDEDEVLEYNPEDFEDEE